MDSHGEMLVCGSRRAARRIEKLDKQSFAEYMRMADTRLGWIIRRATSLRIWWICTRMQR